MTDGERLAGFAEASEGRMHHRQHRRIGHGAQRTGRRSQSLGTNRIIQIRFKNNNARFSKKNTNIDCLVVDSFSSSRHELVGRGTLKAILSWRQTRPTSSRLRMLLRRENYAKLDKTSEDWSWQPGDFSNYRRQIFFNYNQTRTYFCYFSTDLAFKSQGNYSPTQSRGLILSF